MEQGKKYRQFYIYDNLAVGFLRPIRRVDFITVDETRRYCELAATTRALLFESRE
jgi:hypothetical protein